MPHDYDPKMVLGRPQSFGAAMPEDVPVTRSEIDVSSTARDWPRPIGEAARIGLAGDFVGLVAPQSEADANALLVQFLVGFGSAVGHGPYFMAERDRHSMNLFAVVVGQTAGGRKGTSYGHIKEIVSAADPTWQQASGMASGEGIVYHVRDPTEGIDKKTQEKTIIDPGVTDKRLFIYEAEFASVLKVANRDGNTLSTILRTAWESGYLQSLTKNSPMKATGAHISAICHITREELVRLLTTTEAASGFANRFLWACSRRSKVLPDGGVLDEGATQQLVRETATLLMRARDFGQLPRDPSAKAIWHREYERLTDGKAGLLGSMTARAAPLVLRLAGIYALSDPDNRHGVIAADHLAAALEVWDYCERSCLFIFGEKLGDETADDIYSALKANKDGLTRSELHDIFTRNRSAADINRALNVLSISGMAGKSIDPTNNGRPAVRWHAARSGRG